MTKRVFSEIDLGELRVLDTLLRERSITRAAQALETSQPAVSRILKRLRARFSDPLVVRDGRGVQPTARAIEMAAQISALLATADSLRSERVRVRSRRRRTASSACCSPTLAWSASCRR